MDSFDIHLDQDNELKFKVSVEGTDGADLQYQLVLESEKMNCCFPGWLTGEDEISITIPKMQKTLQEGAYNTRLEVIIDDRIFTPLRMTTNAKKRVKVVAEAVVRPKSVTPTVTSASIISNEKTNNNTQAPKVNTKKQSQRKPTRKESIIKQIELGNLTEDQVRNLARKIIESRKSRGK